MPFELNAQAAKSLNPKPWKPPSPLQNVWNPPVHRGPDGRRDVLLSWAAVGLRVQGSWFKASEALMA